jgi:hypothetical protein
MGRGGVWGLIADAACRFLLNRIALLPNAR